jgi:hypothetical protein
LSNRKTSRLRWSLGAVVAILLATGILWWTRRCPSDAGMLIELECSHHGGNATNDFDWNLRVDATGKGTIAVQSKSAHSISMPQAIQDFQSALADSRLCDLPSEIGGARR